MCFDHPRTSSMLFVCIWNNGEIATTRMCTPWNRELWQKRSRKFYTLETHTMWLCSNGHAAKSKRENKLKTAVTPMTKNRFCFWFKYQICILETEQSKKQSLNSEFYFRRTQLTWKFNEIQDLNPDFLKGHQTKWFTREREAMKHKNRGSGLRNHCYCCTPM